MPSGFLGGGVGPRPLARQTLPDPVPVAGVELLTNGGFESWASATNADWWSEFLAGASTINRDAADKHSGSYAARYDIDANSNLVEMYATVALPAATWALINWWGKASTAGTNAIIKTTSSTSVTVPLGTAWAEINTVIRSINGNSAFEIIYSSPSKSAFFDDFSLKALTLSSLFSTRAYASADCDLSAAVTCTAGTQAGLVGRLDSETTPANFLIAYLDGGGNVKVDKCVGGVYTNVISGAITYAAGRVLRLVCSGTSVSAYYNGTQVGSTVTVSDAGIVSNVRHGKFSTYASNSINNYTIA